MKFGTSGLRGLATDLSGEVAVRYCQAFATHMLTDGLAASADTVCVGRDLRSSSPEISTDAMQGLRAAGLSPVDCGVLPTPALAAFAMKSGQASVMVTGSHIPDDRNGIKFYKPSGEINKADEAAISQYAQKSNTLSTILAKESDPKESPGSEVLENFVSRITSFLNTDDQSVFKGLRIGVYEHSSAGRDLLVEMLAYYGATVVPFGRSAKFIPVDTEAVTDETKQLIAEAINKHKLDAVVSTDGDADRPLVADETGAVIPGDILGLVTCRVLRARSIVTPVTSNSSIASNDDQTVHRTRVGSPYVISVAECLPSESTPVVGFEANGGVLVFHDINSENFTVSALPTRDCFLPIFAMLYTSAVRGEKLSSYVRGLKLNVTCSGLLREFPTERAHQITDYLKASTSNVERLLENIGRVHSVDDTDGVRVTMDNSEIIHFRASGNAPEMRCYAEAKTQERAEEILQQGLDLIANFQV